MINLSIHSSYFYFFLQFSNISEFDVCGKNSAFLYCPTLVIPLVAYKAVGFTPLRPVPSCFCLHLCNYPSLSEGLLPPWVLSFKEAMWRHRWLFRKPLLCRNCQTLCSSKQWNMGNQSPCCAGPDHHWFGLRGFCLRTFTNREVNKLYRLLFMMVYRVINPPSVIIGLFLLVRLLILHPRIDFSVFLQLNWICLFFRASWAVLQFDLVCQSDPGSPFHACDRYRQRSMCSSVGSAAALYSGPVCGSTVGSSSVFKWIINW